MTAIHVYYHPFSEHNKVNFLAWKQSVIERSDLQFHTPQVLTSDEIQLKLLWELQLIEGSEKSMKQQLM